MADSSAAVVMAADENWVATPAEQLRALLEGMSESERMRVVEFLWWARGRK